LGGGRELAVDLAPFGKGGDACALLLLRDVSGEKRLEALRSDFIANVSHELKTPISALLGFIETLQGPAREDREATDRFLSIMRGQSERMDRLVGDLLSLSRIELTEHARPTEIVDLGPVLHSLSDAFAIKLAAKNMRLELPPATVWPKVLGAPDELFQVFQNLIDNAIKYGREGEPISIIIETSRDQAIIRKRLPSLREAQALASISVIDRGAGIAREHLPRLTERFYRVDPARSRDMGGTGLGLAIVKHIVNRHRGSLTITSEPGIGSCFTVHLPVEAQ
jgi:two-component system phosphate regulon sensor histidine kinase PhoR